MMQLPAIRRVAGVWFVGLSDGEFEVLGVRELIRTADQRPDLTLASDDVG